jgi:hypothetical protein
MRVIDTQKPLYDPNLETTVNGFIDDQAFRDYKKNYTTVVIPIGLEYRPDLIAKEFLNDETLAWVITYANNFTKGIRDYTPGRTIKIPKI